MLVELRDRLPDGAVAELLALRGELIPDKFRRAVQRRAHSRRRTSAKAPPVSRRRGGRWFRFSFDGHEGTIALNGLEATMDRQWRAAHPDRADEKLDRPDYGQRLAAAFLEMARGALAGQPADATTDGDGTTDDGAGADRDGAASVKAPQRAEPEIMIVITKEKLFDDAEAAGICTTIDGVPLPVATVRKLLVDAKIYPVVLGGDGEILDFGRGRRYFTTRTEESRRRTRPVVRVRRLRQTHPLRRLPPLHPLGRRRTHRHRQRRHPPATPTTTYSPTTATASNAATAPPTPTTPTDNSSTNAPTDGNSERAPRSTSAGIVASMGLRRWFWGVLTRGTPPALDPDEFVELATFPLFDATLLTEQLRNHGLDASCLEAYNIGHADLANGRIFVPRAQLDEARAIVTPS